MYGLLIENISQFIQERYGMEKWNEIRRLAQVEETSFNTHTIYPDVYTKNIIDKACQVLKLTDKHFLIEVGKSFVIFIGRCGYDIILSALGREFRDFLNSLDDLHEYLRLSYPRLRPPSYFCDNENEHGLILHYRTKRNFLLWYTVGQIIKVAEVYYSTDVEIELLSEDQEINEYHFILQLRFDNYAFLHRSLTQIAMQEQQQLPNVNQLWHQRRCVSATGFHPAISNDFPTGCPFNNGFDHAKASPQETLQRPWSTLHLPFPPISYEFFLGIFPFSIVYDSNMTIRQTGNCLQVVCPNILNQNMTHIFSLIKPKIEFTWDSILRHTNTTFELRLIILLRNQNKSRRILLELRNLNLNSSLSSRSQLSQLCDSTSIGNTETMRRDSGDETGDDNLFLQLKGQMIYFASWKSIAFLGAPNLDTLIKTGLYLNDLSMHDFSRDMVLAGQQQSAELKLALDQELHKSRQLEITIKKLDEERRRSDELLYQMKIADKLRIGEKNIETCQFFPSVTILFSDIINFTEICSKIAPMQVVNMLNEIYSIFDQLTERHNIYKVETIGDAYMVAGGLPVHQEESSFTHARKVCMMAMDMIDSVYHIKDPSRGRHLNVRIGIHTGPVVGGIVGQKMPRYCLFGDTVNTSSRIETSSSKMKVQISEVTQRLLDQDQWDIRERGTIRLKGKGMMKTYWLNRKRRDQVTEQSPQLDIDQMCKNGNKMLRGYLRDNTTVVKIPEITAVNSRGSIRASNYSMFVHDRIQRFCNIT